MALLQLLSLRHRGGWRWTAAFQHPLQEAILPSNLFGEVPGSEADAILPAAAVQELGPEGTKGSAQGLKQVGSFNCIALRRTRIFKK